MSTPVSWGELENSGLGARSFKLTKVREHLEGSGDPWLGAGRRARSLEKAQQHLDELLKQEES